MWRTFTILVTGTILASALNLEYLDPTILQTKTSAEIQARSAFRIINKYAKDLVVVGIQRKLFKDNKDSFSLNTRNGKLYISASSGVAAVWGFNYFLKKYCKSQIEWQTKNVRIPDPLPFVNETVTANDRFRYYQNVCTVSYSFVWWRPEEWMEHIDWMALNGINLVLAPVAQEAAWARVYRRVGMTQEEIDQYFTGPSFLSWLRMGNFHGWGGPLPQSWHELQAEIELVVASKMLNLGMVPVVPAFNGHVPAPFLQLFPNSGFYNSEKWSNFDGEYCCDLFVDPSDPLFKQIGTLFLKELNRTDVHIYSADPFNELSVANFSTQFAQATAQAIYGTISEYDDRAVWLLQNWMLVNDPEMWPIGRVQSFINAVPNGRMLILDLQSEQWPQYDLYKMYYGQPFIWCMLHNFGGTLGMFGNMVTINTDVYRARSQVNSTMIGTGLTPEGINQNYVVYDLMLESAWRSSPVEDLDTWVADYAERRYACNETTEAWKYLLKSVYSFRGLNRFRGKYVVTRRPSFKIKPWAWYKSHDLFQAFRKLIFANESNCNSDGYRYDVADITRQALQYRAEQLYMNVVSDRYTNTFVFESSINRFLSALDDMSTILTASDYFTASDWFAKAWLLGKNEDESMLYAMNAKNQITLWGPKGEITDYACKQWDDLLTNYYRPRWQAFLSAALQAKKLGELFDEKATRRVVTATVEIPYIMNTYDYSVIRILKTSSNINNIAKTLYRKWAFIADVSDLPIVVILPDTEGQPPVDIVDIDSDNGSKTPYAVMFTTPTD